MLQAEMIMIECPPKIRKEDFDKALRLSSNAAVAEAVDEINRQYLYWNDVKYRAASADVSRRSCGHA